MNKRYSEKEQILIKKLIDYFKREKDAGKPLLPVAAVYERVHDALGVSVTTIQKLVRDGVKSDAAFSAQRSQASVKQRHPIHEVHEHAIRSRTYAMYASGEHVTLASLRKNLLDLDGVQLSSASLSRAFRKLQFKWKKCSISNRKYLMELPYVAQRRLQFLREYKMNENSEFALKPVYLDETWIYSKGSFRKSWQNDTLKTVRKTSGEGVRYIILHAGSEDGFVENASLIFKSGSKSGDYHDSMNCVNFEKWFEEQLIPNLEEPSLIIMDNAPYHSGLVEKIPNASWTKQSLIDWLEARRIPFPTIGMKDQIWNVAKNHLPAKKYKMDELALQHGHRVLRLPPYHCQYNPIEMVWSECKRYYDAKILSYNSITCNSVLGLWQEAVQQVTSEKWRNYCHHTHKVINEAWKIEKNVDASDSMPIIIDLQDSGSSDDTDLEFSDHE